MLQESPLIFCLGMKSFHIWYRLVIRKRSAICMVAGSETAKKRRKNITIFLCIFLTRSFTQCQRQPTCFGEIRVLQVWMWNLLNIMLMLSHSSVGRHHQWEVMGLKQIPMPVWKLHICQWSTSSGSGKHEAAGQVLYRFLWCTELGNVPCLHSHGFLLLSNDCVLVME